MNSHIEFNINNNVDPLSTSVLKIDPQDIKSETKTEVEECDKFVATDPEDIHIRPVVLCAESIMTIREVENSKACFCISLEDCGKTPKYEQKTAEINYSNDLPIDHKTWDSYETDLEIKKHNSYYVCDCISKDAHTCCMYSFSVNRNIGIESRGNRRSNEIACECMDAGHTVSECNLCSKHSDDKKVVKPFTCNICSKSLSKKSNLTEHLRMHRGEKPFRCNICGKSFSKKSNLATHISVHTGEKPYSCTHSFCSKSFSEKSSLLRHESVHTGRRPFRCNFCKKSFSQKISLTVHNRIHTGEKPFTCNFCNKSFSRKSQLTKHLQSNERLYM